MITYKRISNVNGRLQYEYYPNGDLSAPGIVEFVKGERPKLIHESSKDVKMYFAIHALNGIDTTKETGTIAWN